MLSFEEPHHRFSMINSPFQTEEIANSLFLDAYYFTIPSAKFQRSLEKEKAREQKDDWREKEENKIDLLILYHEGPLSRLIC